MCWFIIIIIIIFIFKWNDVQMLPKKHDRSRRDGGAIIHIPKNKNWKADTPTQWVQLTGNMTHTHLQLNVLYKKAS